MIKKSHTINPSRIVPLLGYIGKGVKVDNAPIDTDRFWLSPNPKFFSPSDCALMQLRWREYHKLDPIPLDASGKEAYKPVWVSRGGDAKMSEAQVKRALLTKGKFPDGSEHHYAPKILEGLSLLTSSIHDDSSYEAHMEMFYKTKQGEMKLVIRCDLEQQNLRMNTETWRLEQVDIPCQRDTEKSCKCKPSIALRLVYRDFAAFAHLPYGYFAMQSGSWHDDSNLQPALGYVEQNYSQPYAIPMSEIPLKLWRESKTYSYLDNGQNKSKTDNVLKLFVTDGFIKSLTDKEAVSYYPSLSAAPAPEPEKEDWEGLLETPEALSPILENDPDFDPFDGMAEPDFAGFEDYDDVFVGGGSGDESPQASDLDTWFLDLFGGSIEETFAMWQEEYPKVQFPSPEDFREARNNGQFLLAKALAEAQIYIPIYQIIREDKTTHAFFGHDHAKIKVHIRTVSMFEDAGFPPELVQSLRESGIHDFEHGQDIFDVPHGVMVMKERQKGKDKGTIYFDFENIVKI